MINLLDLDLDGLAALFAGLGEKPFRAKQVAHWLHQHYVDDIGAMTDLSKGLRERLGAVAHIRGPRVIADTTASDGTRKWLLDVGSANAVETVYIPEGDGNGASSEADAPDGAAADAAGRYRGTLCISSQAGCALDCAFCSTGKQGFNRNLTVAEIVGQLWHANRALIADGIAAKDRPEHVAQPGGRPAAPWVDAGRAPITNVVMMGMGEPLANFDPVVTALRIFIDDDAYGLSRRRVTVSTSGLTMMIDKLRDACPVALAVSLHAPDDALRDRLVPINRKHPIGELLAACKRYLERAPRDFVTFEYVMLDGVNDAPEQARALARLLRDVPCKLNLIPWNPFAGAPFATSSRSRVLAFQRILIDEGYVTTIRKTRGDDIAAACGQLAGRVQDRVKRRLSKLVVSAPAATAHSPSSR